jgi:radical SAM-linked protein
VARQPDGPAPPPVVQRLRIRYAKRGRLRFTSHRDFARAFERALRRAGLPMAYSAGFSPHPKISYVGAAPTGVASEAEYLEIGLAERREPDVVRRDLDAALPAGLDIVAVVEAAGRGLADRVEASWWRIELPGVEPVEAQAAADRFLALTSSPVERATKDGFRTVDARAAVVAAQAIAHSPPSRAGSAQLPGEGGAPDAGETARNVPCAILDLVVRHTTPAVRPDDVLTALRHAAALSTPITPVVTRLAQGLLDESPPETGGEPAPVPSGIRLTDPLAPDVAAVTSNDRRDRPLDFRDGGET